MSYVSRYHGRNVYTFATDIHAGDGQQVLFPLIKVYAVRP
jgi:hypothetical protein